MALRITSDRYNSFKKGRRNAFQAEGEDFPVDLYGKRVFPDKEDSSNLEDAAQDNLDAYGLNTEGLSQE